LRPVIESCLLSGRQLDDLHSPIDLHDKQGTDPQHGVLGVIQ
jgi:hypothetical protein